MTSVHQPESETPMSDDPFTDDYNPITPVELIDTATLLAEIRRRERVEAKAAHRAAFPPPGGPRHYPDRSTLRDVYVAQRQAARQIEERVRMIAAVAKARTMYCDPYVPEAEPIVRADLALWNVRSFDEATAHLTGDAAESAGRSGADDIANLTAIDLAALDYEAGSNDKLAAARRVNESRLHGETGPDGHWTPSFHVETRKDGTRFRRYVSEQVNHIGDAHQIDGGELVVLAVHVIDTDTGPLYHVMQCSKRRLDMRVIPQRNLWAKLHPNRNIPMRRPLQFVYEPEKYVPVRNDADAAADLAWRWANELKLDRDFTVEVEQMPEIDSEFLRSEAVTKHRAEARARGAAYPI